MVIGNLMDIANLFELVHKGADDPVKIFFEKKKGIDAPIRAEITGNVAGICTLSLLLFEALAKEIKSKSNAAFDMWASEIVKTLTKIISEEKEDGDAED